MTDIKCSECGYVKETTEENPTLTRCYSCGAGPSKLKYKQEGDTDG